MKPTYGTAHAAGWDAGNRSMEKAGRGKWNDDDRQVAVEAFRKIMREEEVDNGQD